MALQPGRERGSLYGARSMEAERAQRPSAYRAGGCSVPQHGLAADQPGAYPTGSDKHCGQFALSENAAVYSFAINGYFSGGLAIGAGATLAVGERAVIRLAAKPARDDRWPNEEALARAWEARDYLTDDLRAETGAEVQVVYAGRRNTGDGPDFLDALIVIGEPGQRGRLTRGDIELHLGASDWFAHGHAGNPTFASVILHVVSHSNGIMSIAGAPILEISSNVGKTRKRRGAASGLPTGSGDSGKAAVRRARTGDAGHRSNRERKLEALLEALGDERLEERAAALEDDIALVGTEQALHEALFRGLGYTRNMTPFQEVARLLPIASLRGLTDGAPSGAARHARLAGLLFGAAGLLPSQRGGGHQPVLVDSRGVGAKSRRGAGYAPDAYTAAAEAEWARFGGIDSLPRGAWQTFRVRPDNHPVRRTGLAVALVERWLQGPGLPDALTMSVREAATLREAIRALLDALTMPATGYWAVHRDFGVTRRGGQGALMGRGRALDIIVTAILPFLVAVADLESDTDLERRARAVHAALPCPDESAAARHARARLAQEYGDAANSLRLSAHSQQGLFLLASQFAGGGQVPRESLHGSFPV